MRPVFVSSPAIVCEVGAYASGDVLGGKIALTGIGYNQPVILRSAVLRCAVSTSIAWDLFLFDADPSGSTFTENAAIAVVAADLAKIAGVINFATTDLRLAAAATMGVWTKPDLFMPMRPVTVGALWASIVPRGSITPGAVNAVSLELGFELG